MVSQLGRRLSLAGLLFAVSCPALFSQQVASSPAKNAPVTQTTPASAVPSRATINGPVSLTPAQLIQFLNQTIGWYRRVTTEQATASEPEEQLMLYDNRQIADQVVRLAFDFARAQADTMSEQASAKRSATASATTPQYETLRQMLARLDKNYQDTQTELADDKSKLATATGAGRRKLESTVSELQGELALIAARRDAVQSMAQFISSSAANGNSSAGLRVQIEALAASVPNALENVSESGQPRKSAPAPVSTSAESEPSGIWDLIADLFTLSAKKSSINSLIDQTNDLAANSKDLRTPFVNQLRLLSAQGDQLSAQADTANTSMLDQEREQLDSLAAQFRHISAAVIPLSKQSVLLNLYGRNLTNWRDVIEARYKTDLRNLGVHLGLLAIIFGILFGLGELWRRAVIRYVQEPRRRHQFLLMRRFALWFVIALILAFTLAGKLGSVATFAGLLTAGVALALQNVIVAVVGYFFLIGKFGIRVGDRVQVGGTTGEVIDVGLVRFHLMELDNGGTPTGRVVAFSNSIVFQPAAGLFKQIPGASFAWHEVTTTVPRQVDFTLIRKKLLEAAENVLRDYHDAIARQYRQLEKSGMLISEKELRPSVHLVLSASGVEVRIRYPVDLPHASEIDARMSRSLVVVLEEESETTVTQAPEVHVKTDVPAGGAR